MVGLSGGKEPFNRYYFERLVKKIRKENSESIIIVGDPGTCQFDVFPEKQKQLGIDCIVQGEIEEVGRNFSKMLSRVMFPKRL